jgi:hypothetical protein
VPLREANQGVWSFVLHKGLLGHEKATDQDAPLSHNEMLACSSGGYLWYLWSQRGMDATLASRSAALSRMSAQTCRGLNNFVWLPLVKKLDIDKISPSEGPSWCNLIG